MFVWVVGGGICSAVMQSVECAGKGRQGAEAGPWALAREGHPVEGPAFWGVQELRRGPMRA